MHYKDAYIFRLLCRVIASVFLVSHCISPTNFGIPAGVVHWDWSNFSPPAAYADDLLDTGFAPPIGIARTLSSTSLSTVIDHQVTITYTAFNTQDIELNDVLIATTLAAGVQFRSSSKAPDQNGQKLLWSVGTLAPFASTSISVTVGVNDPIPAVLDGGAEAFGNLNARPFHATAKVASLSTVSIDPALLQSTIDANTTDSYVLTKAGELGNDPQKIFAFVRDSIRYESYEGSLRGARGTLWSGAGNSLDKASLLIALLRVSGVPARYAAGTLDDPHAQELILSMFPAILRSLGAVPDTATALSDPKNDPKLLTESREHYWVELDSDGNGFQAADPSFEGAQIGTTFAATNATFNEVPDSLRHKVVFRVNAETTTPSLLGGSFQSLNEVLNQTFRTVELVGKPVTLGHLVSTNTLGSILSMTTNHYVPYLMVDQADAKPEANPFTQGSGYDEVLSSFPFGSQILTGVFLSLDNITPSGQVTTSDRTVLDRIGFDVRTNGGTPPPFATDQPALSGMDDYTVSVTVSTTPESVMARRKPVLMSLVAQLNGMQSIVQKTQTPGFAPTTPEDVADIQKVATLEQQIARLSSSMTNERYLTLSDQSTRQLGSTYGARIYAAEPRFTITSHTVVINGNTLSAQSQLDLRKNNQRTILRPGQLVGTLLLANTSRGYLEDLNETIALQTATQSTVISTSNIFKAAAAQNIPLTFIGPDNIDALDNYNLSPMAKARISDAVRNNKMVQTPTAMVTIDGKPRIAWYEIDQTTFETVGVREDGLHFVAAAEWLAAHPFINGVILFTLAGIAGVFVGFFFTLGIGALLLLAGVPKGTVGDAANAAGDQLNPDKHNYVGMGAVGTGTFLGGLGLTGELEFAAYLVYQYVSGALADAIQPGTIAAGFMVGLVIGILAGLNYLVAWASKYDPGIAPFIGDATSLQDFSSAAQDIVAAASFAAGAVSATQASTFHRVSGTLHLDWTGSGGVGFPLGSLSVAGANVADGNGAAVGSGTVSLAPGASADAFVFAPGAITIDGNGDISFYAPVISNLGVSATWNNYTASVTGGVTLSVTSDSLLLNGNPLAAGHYQITAASANFGGSGAGSAANFLGVVSLTASQSSVQVGDGTGSLTVGGNPQPTANGYTLTGFSGNAQLTAGGNTNTLELNGSAAQLLYLASSVPNLSTDQNTKVNAQVSLLSSFADTYTVTARAPPGWTVTLTDTGSVSVQPAPGTQSGTFPLFITAQSKADGSLIASEVIPVSVTGTSAAVSLDIVNDTQFFVPFSGAQIPSVFQVTVVNLGPSADTFTFTASNLPAGFALQSGPKTLELPSGETGSLQIALKPDAFPLPPPGTVVQFTGTVTSQSNGSITSSKDVTWIVPEIHALSVMLDPLEVTALPGALTPVNLVVKNIGNVNEGNVVLSSTTPPQLVIDALDSSITLNSGDESLQALTLIADSQLALGTRLAAQIAIEFGATGARRTASVPVNVTVSVPGTEAAQHIQNIAYAAGRGDLALTFARLAELLGQLYQNPGDQLLQSQFSSTLLALELQLDDPIYKDLVEQFENIRTALFSGDTSLILIQLDNLPGIINEIENSLLALKKHNFSIILMPNSAIAVPGVPTAFSVYIQSLGTESTSIELSVGQLPPDVTPTIGNGSITLAPGAINQLGTVTLAQTGSSVVPFGFDVIGLVTDLDGGNLSRSAKGSLTSRDESAQVFSVKPVPAFATPGQAVNFTVRSIAALNTARDLKAYFTLEDSGNNVVFTSSSIANPFGIDSAIVALSVPTLDTTGLPAGFYTVRVFLTEEDSTPIAGAEGTTQLLIGTPIEATLNVSPDRVPPGTSTIGATLHVKSLGGLGSGLQLLGSTQVNGASGGFAIKGDRVYIAGDSFGQVADISDPTHPTAVNTFGVGVPVGNFVLAGASEDRLVAGIGNNPNTEIRMFDLADPLHPALQTPSPLLLTNRQFFGNLYPHGDRVYSLHIGLRYLLGVNDVYNHWGGITVLDVSNMTAPAKVGDFYTASKFDNVNPAIQIDGYGAGFKTGLVDVSDTVAYHAGTNASQDDPTTGQGVIQIFDLTDPANPVLDHEMAIPGTAHILSGERNGNQVMLIGGTGGLNDPAATGNSGSNLFFLRGTMVLTVLDVTDPLHPVITSQKSDPKLEVNFITHAAAVSPGKWFIGERLTKTVPEASRAANQFGAPLFGLVDTNQPGQIDMATYPAFPGAESYNFAIHNGNLVIVAPGAGLLIYSLSNPSEADLSASVDVPKGTGVAVVPNSFNLPPSQIIDLGFATRLIWDAEKFPSPYEPFDVPISWTLQIDNMKSVEARQVLNGGTVDFVYQNTPGSVHLDPAFVSSGLTMVLVPESKVVQPGETAAFQVGLNNPTNIGVVYDLAVFGISPTWIDLPPYVIVNPFQTVVIDLNITPDVGAPQTDNHFTVVATPQGQSGDAGAAASGVLTVLGDPIERNIKPVGVVVKVAPATPLTAGRSNPAKFTARVYNTGSTERSFLLTANAFNFNVQFAETVVDVLPGKGNYRDVPFTVTPTASTASGDNFFDITATEQDNSEVTSTDFGTVTVLNQGVTLVFSPAITLPNSTIQLSVRNSGKATDTFNLALSGPISPFAQLAQSQVTLGAGAVTNVAVTIGDVAFTSPGPVKLVAAATSVTNSLAIALTSADVVITGQNGLAAEFSPPVQTLSAPGATSFLLLVNNIGNLDAAYQATITGTTNGASAKLIGLDGRPAETVPVLRVAGLSSGFVLMTANQSQLGEGTISVQVSQTESQEEQPQQTNDEPLFSPLSDQVLPSVEVTAVIRVGEVQDLCPEDPAKTAPGLCGCGVPETDTDDDGTPDCSEQCVSDSQKTAPGICGCGTADTDSDSDGTPNCNDQCMNDAAKTAPGACGCGVADVDANNNGTPDCVEQGPVCSGQCTGDQTLDEDRDGVSNCQELADHTDPCDSGSHVTQLQPSSCAGANGFLGQVNIATVLNHLSTTLGVRVEYRDLVGTLKGHVDFSLPAFLKRDIIVNDLGLAADTYGTVCVFTTAVGANGWSGGMTIYKRRNNTGAWNPNDEFDFALYYPFRSPQTGRSNWSINTNTVGTDGLGTVANWIRIADASPGDGRGISGHLSYYDIAGNLLSIQDVAVPDGGRFDYAAHNVFGTHNLGQAEFVPDDGTQKYYIETTRYFYEGVGAASDKFYTAFSLPNRPLTGAAVTGRASVLVNQLGVVEMINGSASSLNAELQFFDGQGNVAAAGQLPIPTKGAAHQIVNTLNASSAIQSAQVSGPPESIAATTVIYQLDGAGQLKFAYAPPFTESAGAVQLTEFNSFIEHDNTIELDNSTGLPMKVNVRVLNFDQTQIGQPLDVALAPNGSFRQALALPKDTYGTIIVDSGANTGIVVRNDVSRPFQYILPFLGN